MTDICRKCMKSSKMQVDIFSERHEDEPSLAVMLRECFNYVVKHEDAFPKQLCLDCVLATKNAFQLKRNLEKLNKVDPEVAVKEWLLGNYGTNAAHVNIKEGKENALDAKNISQIDKELEKENQENFMEAKYYFHNQSLRFPIIPISSIIEML